MAFTRCLCTERFDITERQLGVDPPIYLKPQTQDLIPEGEDDISVFQDWVSPCLSAARRIGSI